MFNFNSCAATRSLSECEGTEASGSEWRVADDGAFILLVVPFLVILLESMLYAAFLILKYHF